MVELLSLAGRHPVGHRFQALALARTEQPLQIDRRPPALRLAPEPRQERLQPNLQAVLPAGLIHGPLPPEASPRNSTPGHAKRDRVVLVPGARNLRWTGRAIPLAGLVLPDSRHGSAPDGLRAQKWPHRPGGTKAADRHL